MRVEVHASDVGGCGYYRAIWPGWAVEAGGLAEVDVKIPGSDDPPQLPILWEGSRIIGLGKRDEWPDVLVVQRPLRRHMVTALRLVQEHGTAVVVELDDDFGAVGPRNVAWSRDLSSRVAALRECCELADLVTVSTPRLAERYGAHGRCVVLPNYLPRSHLASAAAVEPSVGPLRVGWSGSVNVHRDDLRVVGNGVVSGLRGTGAEVHVVGTGQDVAKGLGVARLGNATGWMPIEEYPAALAEFDVGLAPLEPTPFNAAKSWLKPLEYAGAGVVCVASASVEYERLLETIPGLDVRLAASPRDWRTILASMLTAGRAELTERGSASAEAVERAGATIENHREEWASAWAAARAYHQRGHR